jgi:hypothetical protein
MTNDGTANLVVRSWTSAITETQTLAFDKAAAGNVVITSSGSGAGLNVIRGRMVLTDSIDITATKTLQIILDGNSSSSITGTGSINILDGTVLMTRQNSDTIGARVINVGDGTGAADSAILRFSQTNMFGSSTGNNSSVVVKSDGKFDLTVATNTNVLGTDNTAASQLVLHGGSEVSQATGGTLAVRNNGSIAVLQVPSAGGPTVATIGGGGTLQLDLFATGGTATRTISVAKNTPVGSTDLQISALLSDGDDAMTYTKTGNGIIEITSNNTTTLDGAGAWNINEGALIASNTVGSATGTKSVNVAADAAIGGDGSVAGNITFASGADFIFNPAATLDVTASVSFGGFSVANLLGLDSSVAYNRYVLLNSIGGSISSTNVSNIGIGAAASLGDNKIAYFDFIDGDLAVNVSAIPEPSAFAALAGLAVLGLVGSRRRRAV